MYRFADITGQDNIIEHLQNTILHNKATHAYVFSGESGMGKKMLAKTYAMTLQCEKGGVEPCMECKSCKQTMSMNQPDIIWVTHEKPTTISVEDIRTQLNNDIVIKPYSSRYKIYIVDEAEKMSAAAQNALLKTIEEPPSYGIIILLTANSSMLLPTIMSRCVELSMKNVDREAIKNYLMKNEKVPDYQAEMAAVFSGGNLGKAVKLATSDHFTELKNDVISFTKNIKGMTAADLGAVIKKTETYKLEISDYLDLLQMWYRDVLMFKASQDVNGLVYRDEYSAISSQASRISYNGIEEILEGIDKVKIRLNANVNFELVMELLYLGIREQIQ